MTGASRTPAGRLASWCSVIDVKLIIGLIRFRRLKVHRRFGRSMESACVGKTAIEEPAVEVLTTYQKRSWPICDRNGRWRFC
ncbi:hypothetical protein B0H67DRAFT_594099 [Lasiosphaeris hirsuta]|uniref:Uncharacterized protein n=1 Tax=Lasiosphaeris hirsuta TaxID=260670 RepID=A0AA39ZXG8_9PEZI|nr:hypothetical protein B0H67DRAFT_594099 [Lasiosphaeris hirsuta]